MQRSARELRAAIRRYTSQVVVATRSDADPRSPTQDARAELSIAVDRAQRLLLAAQQCRTAHADRLQRLRARGPPKAERVLRARVAEAGGLLTQAAP
jgi:hypothetical protein